MATINGTTASVNPLYEVPDAFLRDLRADKAAHIDKLPDTIITIDGKPAIQTSQGPFFLLDEASVLNRKWQPPPGEPRPLDLKPQHAKYVNTNAFLRNATPKRTSVSMPPDKVTHSPTMPVRNQGHRNTCVAHATVAAMEMQLGGIDLSEQCAHHHLMRAATTPTTCCIDPGVFVIDAGNDLIGFGIPHEGEFSYTSDKPGCNTSGTCHVSPHSDPLPVFHSTHSIAEIGAIPFGATGNTIGNVQYLETIIAAGFDIVYEFWISAIFNENVDVIDVHIFRDKPMPHGNAAHAVLLTGYDHTNQFFIGRNSFGPLWGTHGGDVHLSYGFVTLYSIAGFIIKRMA